MSIALVYSYFGFSNVFVKYLPSYYLQNTTSCAAKKGFWAESE